MNHSDPQNIQVLIIEDDVRVAEINRRFIEKVPHFAVIGIATNKEEALLQLQLLEPDLVFLDVYFPDMDGMDILSVIKERHPHTDVIMLTAAREADTVVCAVRSGVFDFIAKPLIFDRLSRTLEAYYSFKTKVVRLTSGESVLNQADIDGLRLVGKDLSASIPDHDPKPWIKGIDRLTAEKVLRLLETEVMLTTEQTGIKLGISRSTARRYLEFLADSGRAATDLTYGTIGRPERVYKFINP